MVCPMWALSIVLTAEVRMNTINLGPPINTAIKRFTTGWGIRPYK